jgi:hypothetical protein
MKYYVILIPAFLLILSGCGTSTDYDQVLEDIQENLDFGNLSMVIQITDSMKKAGVKDEQFLHIADSLEQIAQRINLDFPVSEAIERDQLEKLIGPYTEQQKETWENIGWLESRIIDGEKKYFSRAASNLLLLKKFHEQKEESFNQLALEPEMIFRLKHTEQVIKASEDQNLPVKPVKMRVNYTITVHPDVVPDGEKIRCWMPWPKPGHSRQKEIKLINTSSPEYMIAPDTATHSTIYMESISKKGTPSVFTVSFEYQSAAQSFNMSKLKIQQYDLNSALYQKYTAEQLPDICFTDNVRKLADSIAGNDRDPASVVKKTYLWFKETIPWAGAIEYSIIQNIPEYVIKNMHGDCGMQTFLFLSMLRYRGIPARWQSGWMMPPDNKNLHDWCEVYYEGVGWVPVDISYELQKSENTALKEFYLSGIDSYRLIINDGVAGPLHPLKEYLRSEPNDFQRGEVEWKGGNLYFDKWDYDMKIEYLNQ